MARNWKLAAPCPVCHGYNGASRKANRCKGFLSDFGVPYCQNVESSYFVEPFGVRLYRHTIEDFGVLENSSASSKLVSTDTYPTFPPTTNENGSQNTRIPESEKLNTDLTIVMEETHYPERPGPWGWPEHTEVWYVVYRGTEEVTRSKSKRLLRGWINQTEE